MAEDMMAEEKENGGVERYPLGQRACRLGCASGMAYFCPTMLLRGTLGMR